MRRAALLVLLLSQGGCYSTSRYDVASTMPAGKLNVTVASEVGRVRRERPDARFGTASERHDFLALAPVTVARYAPVDGFELGGTVGVTRLTAETKLRLMDDLALAPGGGLLGDIFLVDTPVLVGARPHRRITLVASPGVSFAKPLVEDERVRPEGWYLRAGVALRIELLSAFALVPEITTMTGVSGGQRNWTTAGLGFQFGPLP